MQDRTVPPPVPAAGEAASDTAASAGTASIAGTGGSAESIGAQTGAGSTAEATATTSSNKSTGAQTEAESTADATAPSTSNPPAEQPYSLAATRACLRSSGAEVSGIRSTDPSLRALGDLAQRTSLEISINDRIVGLGFGDTRLLASLLRVPNDPYRIEVRKNALLMYRPAARAEATVVRSCLRT